MSRLADLITQNRPDWPMLPAELERAWVWLEQNGYGSDAPDGFDLGISHDEDSLFSFTSRGSLAGWLEADDSGHTAVLPIAEDEGSGATIALWRHEGEVLAVLLGSGGERGVLAGDVRELLTLLAIGYEEISGFTLGAEPEETVDVSAYRAWIEGTLGVDVPAAWSALSDGPGDAFGEWLAEQRGEGIAEVEAPRPALSPGPQVDGDLAIFLGLLGAADDQAASTLVSELLDAPLRETLRSSSRALGSRGVEVDSTRSGIRVFWIRVRKYPRAGQLMTGIDATSTREDVLALLGEPERAGAKHLRYVVGGRYLHFEFEDTLALVTMMIDAP